MPVRVSVLIRQPLTCDCQVVLCVVRGQIDTSWSMYLDNNVLMMGSSRPVNRKGHIRATKAWDASEGVGINQTTNDL